MASTKRVQIPVSFQTVDTVTGDLKPVVGATVSVINRDNNLTATVFAGLTGSGTIGLILTDSLGNVPGYVVEGSYTIHVGAVSGFGGAVLNWEAARGDGVGNVAPGAIGTAQLQAGCVTYPILDPLTVQRNLVPVGAILPFAGAANTVPNGWLLADGSVYARASFPALFAVCGTHYNVGGEGGANFRVPNLTDSFPLGKGTNALGVTGGVLGHTHSVPDLFTEVVVPAHSHDIPNLGIDGVGDHAHWFFPEMNLAVPLVESWRMVMVTQSGSTQAAVPNPGSGLVNEFFSANAGAHSHALSGFVGELGTVSGDTTITGIGAASTTDATGPADPPYTTVNYIIKADVGA